MLPIHIFNGSELYLLVRAETQRARDAGDNRVASSRARMVLEAALRRRDSQLIRELAELLHMRGEDPEDVAARALRLLATTGSVAGDLVLVQAQQGEVERVAREQPEEEPERVEPEDEVEEEEEKPPEARTTIRISLFFDGTANNRANTEQRLLGTALAKKKKKQGSFQNDYSNVSRLEARCTHDPSFAHKDSLYVEGIGTMNLESDNKIGMGLGMGIGSGETGVKAKVRAGVEEALRTIRDFGISNDHILERVHFDAFGFSRGAAAARYFVHYVLTENPLQPRIEALGYTIEEFEINFIGLFDTVASYGVVHSNDTADLNLNSITAAKKVVQLAAAEEHRKNFRLTNIDSTAAGGTGIEIFLPGVHSDVGGGYTANAVEENLQILDFDQFSNAALVARFERETQWLLDSGWYTEAQIDGVNMWNELIVNRTVPFNTYDRIPLKHMAEFATETGLTFDSVAQHHPVPPDLATVEGLIAAHVAAQVAGTGTSTAEHWLNQRGPVFQHLRNQYLHFSASYGSVNQPQFSAGGAKNGQRQRIVQWG